MAGDAWFHWHANSGLLGETPGCHPSWHSLALGRTSCYVIRSSRLKLMPTPLNACTFEPFASFPDTKMVLFLHLDRKRRAGTKHGFLTSWEWGGPGLVSGRQLLDSWKVCIKPKLKFLFLFFMLWVWPVILTDHFLFVNVSILVLVNPTRLLPVWSNC